MEDIRPPQKGEPSKVDQLQRRLYSPNEQFGVKKRKSLSQKEFDTGSDWNDGSIEEQLKEFKPKKKFNYFYLIFIFAFLFFAGAVGYAALTFLGGNQIISGEDVDLAVIGPVSIGGGEELELDIVVQNSNQSRLETVDLIIEYPEGTKKADDLKTDLPRVREGLGIVEPNSVIKSTQIATLFGEEGSSKEIKIIVEYRLPGSNAIFQKEKTFEVVLQSSPIRLRVESVKEITPDQELEFEIELASNSNQTLENVMIVADYPFGFNLESSEYETYDGNNVWVFDQLRPQEKINFIIKGKIEGQDNEERIFTFNAGIQDENTKNELGVKFSSLPKSVTISRPFLDLKIAIDEDEDSLIVKNSETQLNGKVTFTNNTDSSIENAQVVMKLSGVVLDKSSVSVTEGFYKSQDNTIIWDGTSATELVKILPGDSGVFAFSFKTRDLANQTSVFKDPEIVIDVVATGRRVAEEDVPEEIRSTAAKRILFSTDVGLSASTNYSGGTFQNSGPIPPKVDQDTTYTIKWTLSNSSSELNNAKVSAVLPTYVRWNNKISGDGTMSFDPVTRIIEWNIGTVLPHAGYTISPKEMYFQVTLTPSISQVGQSPNLTGDLRFTGFDTFTERTTNRVAEPSTTNIGSGNNLFDGKVSE